MAASKNQRVIIEELAKIGLKPHAIAGIMANLQHENSFKTTVNNGDGGQASGIAQWHPDRFARVIRVAKKMGVPPTDIRAQARTLALSIKDEGQSGPTGTTTVESLNRLDNPAAVAKFFDENYERSDGTTRQSRMQAAKNYIKMSNRYSSGDSGSSQPTPKVPGSDNGTMTWVPKVGTDVSNPFGAPNSRYESGRHTGTDIQGGAGGQPIRWAPPVSGKVVKRASNPNNDYGYYIIVRDEKDREWLLAHMQGPGPEVGTVLSQGDKIGKVGDSGTNSSGAHLHIEMTAPLAKGEHWEYNNVKKPKLVFKVGPDGQTYDKDFKPVKGDYLDAVGLSGQALQRPGNEELRELIERAVDEDWTGQEFTRRFKNSEWYQARAQSQREFDMMQDTDQQQKIKQGTANAKATAAQMGVELSDEEARRLAIKMQRDGFTDDQARWFIAKRFEYSDDKINTGVASAYEQQLKEFAREYGVRLGPEQMQAWIRDSMGTGADISTYEDRVRQIAYDQNPFLRDAYDKGFTTREALGSKLSTAQAILGAEDSDIDLSDPKWRNIFDANGNEISDQEWSHRIKTDAAFRYGWTQNGINEAKTIGRNMLRAMGVLSNG